jgi:hypothetical protein
MLGMDPFDALFRLQRALDTRLDSDWLSNATTGTGAFPPINLFQQGHDYVAVIELLELSQTHSTLRPRRVRFASPAPSPLITLTRRAYIGANG